MVAEVIINRSAKKLNRVFDYNIPKELEELIFVGSKVIVQFGKGDSLIEAFVTKIKDKSDTKYKLKDIIKVVDNLNTEQIKLAKWIARKYFCNISECIKLMLPPGTKNNNIEKRIKDKTINVIYLAKEWEEIESKIENNEIKSEKQIKLLNFLRENEGCTIAEVEDFTECTRAIVKTLEKNKFVEIIEKKIERNPLEYKVVAKSNKLKLNIEQQVAFDEISKDITQCISNKYLIYGITGSGKTEIYLQLIEYAIAIDKTAIVLVPEISLTPQMLERFISRFGKENIAVIHSKLSIGERYDEWNRIKEGRAKIVIGARSAIFAPIQNIGIIIIDEEHDSSYKSEMNPRYDAKEIAVKISEQGRFPVVLGSATPDIRTYYEAENNGKTKLIKLTKRANNSKLPRVEIIDLKQELAMGNRSMISNALYEKIEKNINDKKQTILFLNRRGYSTFIMCRDCGYTIKCKNCNISMTYHSFENRLKCHYCGYEEKVASVCPECGSEKIRYFGTGTQKLEQEIHRMFPMARTLRMDVDTVTKKNSHEIILNQFRDDNIDILIGTQMVVKGHHFPNVTLVGVVAADGSLNINDYRANERTFQLLTQVAGRAGREKEEGYAIIQTYSPHSFSIECASKQDYERFYKTEIALRKQLNYPPFCDIIVIGFQGREIKELQKVCQIVYNYLCKQLDKNKFKIFQPMPAPIDKIQNKIRWRMILKGIIDEQTNVTLNMCLNGVYKLNIKNTKISIDVNPNNMM